MTGLGRVALGLASGMWLVLGRADATDYRSGGEDAADLASEATVSVGGLGGAPSVPEPAGTAVAEVPPAPVLDLRTEQWTIPSQVVAAVRAVRERPLGERVAVASQSFLGLPYVLDAAGEGTVEDPDPVGRYDAFDCLTFVEETLAIAMAGDPLDAPMLRNAFRYDGPASYSHRRHFMEAEWIPDAVRNGLVTDITARLGPARTLTKTVTADTWKSWRRRSLFSLPAEALPVGSWSLNYLDLAEAELAAPRFPPGAIVLTLRQDRPHVPVVITHVSLVIPGRDGLLMRHATKMGSRKVRDDRLSWYVTHIRDYVNWRALGIAVLLPREQGPRLSALSITQLPPTFPPAEGPLPEFAAGALHPAASAPAGGEPG